MSGVLLLAWPPPSITQSRAWRCVRHLADRCVEGGIEHLKILSLADTLDVAVSDAATVFETLAVSDSDEVELPVTLADTETVAVTPAGSDY